MANSYGSQLLNSVFVSVLRLNDEMQVAGHMWSSLNSKSLFVAGFLLRMLTSPLGTVLLFGRVGLSWRYPFIQSFVDLSPEQREKGLQSWIRSSLAVFPQLFKLFKGFVLFNFYGKVSARDSLLYYCLIGVA